VGDGPRWIVECVRAGVARRLRGRVSKSRGRRSVDRHEAGGAGAPTGHQWDVARSLTTRSVTARKESDTHAVSRSEHDTEAPFSGNGSWTVDRNGTTTATTGTVGFVGNGVRLVFHLFYADADSSSFFKKTPIRDAKTCISRRRDCGVARHCRRVNHHATRSTDHSSPRAALGHRSAFERTRTPEYQSAAPEWGPGCVRRMKIESDLDYSKSSLRAAGVFPLPSRFGHPFLSVSSGRARPGHQAQERRFQIGPFPWIPNPRMRTRSQRNSLPGHRPRIVRRSPILPAAPPRSPEGVDIAT